MDNGNKINLKELFEQFLDKEQTAEAIDNISNADKLLEENPAPQPGEKLIADIKANISAKLEKHRPLKSAVYKVVSVAAVFIILAAVSVKLFQQRTARPEQVITAAIPTSIWESEDLSEDDEQLAVLNTEIEDIESRLFTIQLSETSINGSSSITELETELVEINSDFWKG